MAYFVEENTQEYADIEEILEVVSREVERCDELRAQYQEAGEELKRQSEVLREYEMLISQKAARYQVGDLVQDELGHIYRITAYEVKCDGGKLTGFASIHHYSEDKEIPKPTQFYVNYYGLRLNKQRLPAHKDPRTIWARELKPFSYEGEREEKE